MFSSEGREIKGAGGWGGRDRETEVETEGWKETETERGIPVLALWFMF